MLSIWPHGGFETKRCRHWALLYLCLPKSNSNQAFPHKHTNTSSLSLLLFLRPKATQILSFRSWLGICYRRPLQHCLLPAFSPVFPLELGMVCSPQLSHSGVRELLSPLFFLRLMQPLKAGPQHLCVSNWLHPLPPLPFLSPGSLCSIRHSQSVCALGP